MEDSKIVALFFERNESALDELDKKYKRYCQSIANNILSSIEDAEECVSDTYLAVWKSIPPNKPNNLTAFLGKITRNLALDRLEKNQATKREGKPLVLIDEIAEVFSDNEQNQLPENIALREAINKFLKSLPREKRILFLRRYFFFDSVKELAASQKTSESQIKTALFRIRNKLKDYLLAEGIEP